MSTAILISSRDFQATGIGRRRSDSLPTRCSPVPKLEDVEAAITSYAKITRDDVVLNTLRTNKGQGAYLQAFRWPKGFVCPASSHEKGHQLAHRRLTQRAY